MKALRGLTTDQKMVAMRDRLFQEFDDAKRQLKEQYTMEFSQMRSEYKEALDDTKRYHREEIEKLKATLIKQREVHDNDKQKYLQQLSSRRQFSQDITRCKICLSNSHAMSDSATSGQIKEVMEDYERQLAICRKTINDQKLAYENRLAEEKGKLQDAFMEEKVAFEEMAFRRLNIKLEKQLKWRDLLLLEQGILSTVYDSSRQDGERDRDSGTEVEESQRRVTNGKQPDDDFSLLRKAMLESFTAEKQHLEQEHKQTIEGLKVSLSRECQRTVMRERKIHKRTIEQLHIDFQVLKDENNKLKELLSEQHTEQSLAIELVDVISDMKEQILALETQLQGGEMF